MRLAAPRAIPLLVVLAAFFGLTAMAHAQPGNVAVFNNPDYVDNSDPNFGAEGPNTIASLQSFGENVTVFTDVTGFAAALAGQDTLVIPEQENASSPPCLSDDMDQASKDAVKNFVAAGGQLVDMSIQRNACNDKFVNDVFGFNLPVGSPVAATRGLSTFTLTADAAGTEFAGGPASIPPNNGTGALAPTDLPAGAKAIYADAGGNAAVVDIPFGDGSITLLGWDWFNSSPPNPELATAPTFDSGLRERGGAGPGQDFGWQDVFRRSVDLPVITINDVSVTEGNSGTTLAGFTVTASQPHSEVLHVNYGTADGTATAGSDYTNTTGSLTFQRTDNALGVNVPVIGDTTIEPDETFRVGLAAGSTPAALAIGKASGIGTIVNDDVAKPKVGVAGVRRACVSSSTVNVRFSITAAAGIKSVTVSLDGKRVAKTTKGRFTVSVKTGKLKAGRHTLTAVAIDNRGQKTTVHKTIARCAAAKPKARTGPRFTG
jgi:Calx-beta domain-containing protein/Big-like domain-containing protein